MPACGPVFDLSFFLYLFSPLLVPLGFAAAAVIGSVVAGAFRRG